MEINNIRSSQKESKPNDTVLGITYGYIWVSTVTQHDDRQRFAMKEFGITADHIFVDKQSGKDFARPAYMDMMATLKPGDTVVVQSLDRLGRDYEEMIR
ncbi:MAG: recombinase family protein [Selenomonadaceae bacterium]|nr:recombinase family protein [Selenomonadaceae bacterium]